MTWMSRSASATPAATAMPASRWRTTWSASSAAKSSTRPVRATAKRRMHGAPEATATARSSARKDLQHFGSPPTMPTASSPHSWSTSQRRAVGTSARSAARVTGSEGEDVIAAPA
jgi:hypothetical protein